MRLITTILIASAAFAQVPYQPTGQVIAPYRITAHNGSYTVLASDLGAYLSTNTSATWALPQCGTGSFKSSRWVGAMNVGASGNLTITTTTSTFYGAGTSGSSMTVAPGASATLICDGTNWAVNAGGSGGGALPGTTGQLITTNGSGAATASTCTSTSGSIACPGAGGAGGGFSFFDSGGVKFYGFAAPTTITGSGCILDIPAGNPAGQVIEFAVPSGGHCAGSWVSAGGGSPVNPGFWFWGPGYTASLGGNVNVLYNSSTGVGSYAFTAAAPSIPNLTFYVTAAAGATASHFVVGIYSFAGSPKIPTTQMCASTVTGSSPSNMLVGTNLTSTGWKTISWDSGCTSGLFTTGDQYALVMGSDDASLQILAAADVGISVGAGTLNPSFAGYLGSGGLNGSSSAFVATLPGGWTTHGTGSQSRYPMIRGGN